MSRTITIDPVTRIEGHGRITIQLDEAGEVADARFHVTQLRGFEKLSEGRPFREMPSLMARICGICPVSHLITSAKTCDELLAVRIPPTAASLRRILNLAQIIQSHALSFFYLSAPDLLLGMDAPIEERSLFGVAKQNPELARSGVRLRQFGQQVIETLAGHRIHPGWVVAGGVDKPLDRERRAAILAQIPEVKNLAIKALEWFAPLSEQFRPEIAAFANFPSMHMGLVNEDGTLEHYDGIWRLVDAYGNVVRDIEPYEYNTYIGEAVEPDSYLKSPYYKPIGYPEGLYRVGPLSRLIIAKRCGTRLADEALERFRATVPQEERQSSFYYHYARLIEILYGIERIEALLEEPEILNTRVQSAASANNLEGVAVAEAPRGTLLHHYRIDETGLIQFANLVIATGHNSLAMNRGVLQTSRAFIHDGQLGDGILNRVEAVIRAFDPCLSCSTHAAGQMALRVQLVGPDGALLDEMVRG